MDLEDWDVDETRACLVENVGPKSYILEARIDVTVELILKSNRMSANNH